jgi:NADPH:quinone reductase-like Zn-dependent oxidoreductase
MKAWEIRNAFGLENLVLAERPDPTPGPYEVLVRVRAASLNYRDVLMIRGLYNPKQKLPLVPLSDGTGEVVAIGAHVTRFRVGDRVATTFCAGWEAGEAGRAELLTSLGGPLDGPLSELFVAREGGLVHLPPRLSFEEAAALPCAAVTAWSALVSQGRVRAGDTVLVQGTGGVSIFALQFAKLHGATVIVTSSSDAKLERARALGADHTINYRTHPEWGKVARERTGNVGVDHIVEVGGAGTLAQSLRAVRPFGTISVIGVLAGGAGDVSLFPILMQNVRLQGVIVGPRKDFEAMLRAIDSAGMTPVVDRVFPMHEFPKAIEHMGEGAHFGKIVVQVG